MYKKTITIIILILAIAILLTYVFYSGELSTSLIKNYKYGPYVCSDGRALTVNQTMKINKLEGAISANDFIINFGEYSFTRLVYPNKVEQKNNDKNGLVFETMMTSQEKEAYLKNKMAYGYALNDSSIKNIIEKTKIYPRTQDDLVSTSGLEDDDFSVFKVCLEGNLESVYNAVILNEKQRDVPDSAIYYMQFNKIYNIR